MSRRFAGKVAIVTAGGSGIGAAVATRLLDEGASVMISGRTDKRLSERTSKMPADRTGTFVANVSSRRDCDALVAETVERFGRVDTLVNAAGMNLVGTIEETSDEDWEECITSDLSGVFYMSRAAVPHLKETKGSIVNIGSVSSLGGGWSHAAYNAAKAVSPI